MRTKRPIEVMSGCKEKACRAVQFMCIYIRTPGLRLENACMCVGGWVGWFSVIDGFLRTTRCHADRRLFDSQTLVGWTNRTLNSIHAPIDG